MRRVLVGGGGYLTGGLGGREGPSGISAQKDSEEQRTHMAPGLKPIYSLKCSIYRIECFGPRAKSHLE